MTDAEAGPALRAAFVTPIDPATPGNGLAHRARAWARALRRLGPVTTVLVPTHGPAEPGDHTVVALVEPSLADVRLPDRCARAPDALGRAWGADHEPVDVVVALRADLGPFALGAGAVLGARVVVDLDDDDVAYHRSRGDHETADRYLALVRRLRGRADLLTSVTGFGPTTAVPNAVTIPEGRPIEGGSPAAAQVLMVGNFHYAPNIEGYRWFADEVWPLVLDRRPGAVLVAAGPGSEDLDGGLGYVPDIGERYAAAAVAIVAVRHGSGSRIKALEAFAHEVPVVGTSVGLEGLDVVDGRDCLLADGAPELAGHVVGVLTDPDLARSLARSARRLVRDRYRAEAIERQVATLVADLVRSGPPSTWGPADGLEATETPTGLAVIDPATATVHELNPSAAAVFALADGSRSRPAVTRAFAELFDVDDVVAGGAVESAARDLVRAGLLVPRPVTAPAELRT